MEIKFVQVGENRIAQNPLTGDWFVFLGENKAATYICRTKPDAVATAKRIKKKDSHD